MMEDALLRPLFLQSPLHIKMAMVGLLFIATVMLLWSSSDSKQSEIIKRALAWAERALLQCLVCVLKHLGGMKHTREK